VARVAHLWVLLTLRKWGYGHLCGPVCSCGLRAGGWQHFPARVGSAISGHPGPADPRRNAVPLGRGPM